MKIRCQVDRWEYGPCVTAGTEFQSEELQELLRALAKDHPSRVAECRSLLAGLRRVTLVAAEEWQLTVQAAIVEIRRRLVTLKTEAARAQSASAIEAASSAVIWQRRYSTLLAHAVSDLRRLLQVRNISSFQQRQVVGVVEVRPCSPHAMCRIACAVINVLGTVNQDCLRALWTTWTTCEGLRSFFLIM